MNNTTQTVLTSYFSNLKSFMKSLKSCQKSSKIHLNFCLSTRIHYYGFRFTILYITVIMAVIVETNAKTL